jgi:cobalamin synthase
MTDKLDDWVAELAATATDHRLDRLEMDVGRDIAHRRSEARALKAFAPVRLGAIGLALAIGVAAGSVTATAAINRPRTAGVFAVAQLAPSTLLEGAR